MLMNWDLLVVDKPTGARSRSDKSTEHVLEETTRRARVASYSYVGQEGSVHMKCDNPRCRHEFCWLCFHDWSSATHDASFCTGTSRGLAFGGFGVRGEADTLQLGSTSRMTRRTAGYIREGGTSALPRGTHHTS